MILEPDLPPDALSSRYRDEDGHYTDCFAADVPGEVSLVRFVEAFYTAWLFRCERVILKYAFRRPSNDADARAVANGTADSFAAWTMEDRTENQLLMCDMHETTRSWFKVEPKNAGTRLYFGSAVIARNGQLSLVVKAFMPLHRLYSRLLLKGAVRRLGHSTFRA